VTEQLLQLDPHHNSKTPWEFDNIFDATMFTIENDILLREDPGVKPASLNNDLSPVKDTFDVSKLLEVISQGDPSNMISLLNKVVNKDSARKEKSGSPRPRNTDCIFCSDPNHFYHECPKVAEYIKKGLCKRNDTNQIVLPDGQRVPRFTQGKNLMEKIDNWHKANAPSKSSNIVEVSSCAVKRQRDMKRVRPRPKLKR